MARITQVQARFILLHPIAEPNLEKDEFYFENVGRPQSDYYGLSNSDKAEVCGSLYEALLCNDVKDENIDVYYEESAVVVLQLGKLLEIAEMKLLTKEQALAIMQQGNNVVLEERRISFELNDNLSACGITPELLEEVGALKEGGRYSFGYQYLQNIANKRFDRAREDRPQAGSESAHKRGGGADLPQCGQVTS